jgi:hypothetical protein
MEAQEHYLVLTFQKEEGWSMRESFFLTGQFALMKVEGNIL